MPISSRSFVRSTASLLVVGLVVLVAIVAMTFWLAMRAQVYFDGVIAARDARTVAVELRNAVQTAEASQRGFLYSGNEIYLAPYDRSKGIAMKQLGAEQAAFADYPELKAVVDRIGQIVPQKFDEMDQTIALKRNRQDDAAMALFRTNRGKTLMDEANVLFSGAINAADARLTQGVAEHRSNAVWLRWFSIAGGLVIILVVGAATIAVIRYTRELSQARDEVNALNEGLEERVRDRTADLAQANEEVQRFAYIVTHDLRAPLVNIMGFTSELERGVQSLQTLIDRSLSAGQEGDPIAHEARLAAKEDLPEAIGFIRSSTKKMDGLINAILRISREGSRVLRPVPIALDELVRASGAAIAHQVQQAEGSIVFDLKQQSLASDPQAVEQIIGNLLDNAVKYRASGRPPVIKVATEPVAGGGALIRVSDNGRGIAEKDLDRVFEIFRRSGPQDQPGEGIGLAYVKSVVRKLDGTIAVTSRLGEGTTFEVCLPNLANPLESYAA